MTVEKSRGVFFPLSALHWDEEGVANQLTGTWKWYATREGTREFFLRSSSSPTSCDSLVPGMWLPPLCSWLHWLGEIRLERRVAGWRASSTRYL